MVLYNSEFDPNICRIVGNAFSKIICHFIGTNFSTYSFSLEANSKGESWIITFSR